MAVTVKVPAVLSANVVDAAEVMEGPVAVTVKVKDWVAVLALASVAVFFVPATRLWIPTRVQSAGDPAGASDP